jgi:hypothetical protein
VGNKSAIGIDKTGSLTLDFRPASAGATPMVDPIFDPAQISEEHAPTLDPDTLAIYAKAFARPCAFGILHFRP